MFFALRYHLGTTSNHTVFEAEAVDLPLATKLLLSSDKPQFPMHIFIDNQAVAQSTKRLSAKPGHYILMKPHPMIRAACTFDITSNNIIITWASGHKGIKGTELADEEACCAASHTNHSSHPSHLPIFLWSPLPASASALKQANREHSKRQWAKEWMTSPWYDKAKLLKLDKPSNCFIKLSSHLSKCHTAMLIWLCTGHSSLHNHLHHLKKVNLSYCPFCTSVQR